MLSKFFKFVKKNIERNNEEIILFIGVALISFLSFTVGCIISEAKRDEPMQIQTNIDDMQTTDKIQIDDQK